MPAAHASKPTVLVAIPCHNEARYIQDIVAQCQNYADHILVVDDGSTDGSAKLAHDAGAQVISHPKSRGYGGAIITAIQSFLATDYDILLTIDGDGQHNPAEMPTVLAPLFDQEAELVVGSRFMGRYNNVARYRKFGIDVITSLYNFAWPDKITDAQSGFRAYHRRLLSGLNLHDPGMGFSVEILIKARAQGHRFKEVPISCIYHDHSSSMNPVRHGVGVALDVLRYRLLLTLHARQLH